MVLPLKLTALTLAYENTKSVTSDKMKYPPTPPTTLALPKSHPPLPPLYYIPMEVPLTFFKHRRTVPRRPLLPRLHLPCGHGTWCMLLPRLLSPPMLEPAKPPIGGTRCGHFACSYLSYVLRLLGKRVRHPRATTCLNPPLILLVLPYPMATTSGVVQPQVVPIGLAKVSGGAASPRQELTSVLYLVKDP